MKLRTSLGTVLLLFALVSGYSGYGQTAVVGITTLPLAFSTACPGSAISVPYTSTGVSPNIAQPFVVQVSDGGVYADLQTYTLSYTNTFVAKLPADLPVGKTYQVRLANPALGIIGTVSPTLVTIKNGPKPAPPIASELALFCRNPSANGMSIGASISIQTVPGSLLTGYGANNRYATPDNAFSYPGTTYRSIRVYAGEGYSGPFITPISEGTYYFTQTVNGCESEPTKTVYRVLDYMGAPIVANHRYGYGGSARYCQGDKAVPLSVYGYTPSSDPRFYVTIYDRKSGKYIDDFTPNTNVISFGNSGAYALSTCPFDGKIACCTYYQVYSYLGVDVYPIPDRPTPISAVVSYLQGQPAISLTAIAANATKYPGFSGGESYLRWYGPDLTNPQASTIAPIPATDRPGSYTYTVSEVFNGCESQRNPIVVTVNPLLTTENPALVSQVTAYPVPATNLLTVDITPALLKTGTVVLELADASGRTVYQQETRETKTLIPLQRLAPGTYWLRVKTANGQVTQRIMRE